MQEGGEGVVPRRPAEPQVGKQMGIGAGKAGHPPQGVHAAEKGHQDQGQKAREGELPVLAPRVRNASQRFA